MSKQRYRDMPLCEIRVGLREGEREERRELICSLNRWLKVEIRLELPRSHALT